MLPANRIAVMAVDNDAVPYDERGFAAIRHEAFFQQLQFFLVQRRNQIPEFGINCQVIQFLFRHSYLLLSKSTRSITRFTSSTLSTRQATPPARLIFSMARF